MDSTKKLSSFDLLFFKVVMVIIKSKKEIKRHKILNAGASRIFYFHTLPDNKSSSSSKDKEGECHCVVLVVVEGVNDEGFLND